VRRAGRTEELALWSPLRGEAAVLVQGTMVLRTSQRCPSGVAMYAPR